MLHIVVLFRQTILFQQFLVKRVFKGTGVVLARIECSPKIFDFRANGILDQKSVDFFDTLKQEKNPAFLFV